MSSLIAKGKIGSALD